MWAVAAMAATRGEQPGVMAAEGLLNMTCPACQHEFQIIVISRTSAARIAQRPQGPATLMRATTLPTAESASSGLRADDSQADGRPPKFARVGVLRQPVAPLTPSSPPPPSPTLPTAESGTIPAIGPLTPWGPPPPSPTGALLMPMTPRGEAATPATTEAAKPEDDAAASSV